MYLMHEWFITLIDDPHVLILLAYLLLNSFVLISEMELEFFHHDTQTSPIHF